MSSNPGASSSLAGKKAKKKRTMSPEEESKLRRTEAETLRQYIKRCTEVPSDCPAIRAALSGIDEEIKRIDRDEKLRLKFSGAATTTSAKKSSTTTAGKKNVDDEDMEWQDVGACDDVDETIKINQKDAAAAAAHMEGGDLTASVQLVPPAEAPPARDSPLGRELASLSIASVAEAGATVSHPLAAIAIAIHSSLISDVLGFRCTGIPDDEDGKASKGFAKPIRELPPNVFVPDKWDQDASGWTGYNDASRDTSGARVVLRYRKDGVGSVVLRVAHCDDVTDNHNVTSPPVRVRFGPAGKNDVQTGPPDFPIGDHINLDGLAAALSRMSGGERGVPPALHYRALSTLLTDFADSVDLGFVKEEVDEKIQMEDVYAPVAAAEISRTNVVIPPAVSNDPLRVGPPPVPVQPGRWSGLHDHDRQPRIDDFGVSPHPGGDFAGDLAPGGIIDPRIRPGSGVSPGGGNLMGPTHPAFRGGVDPNYYDDGGLDFDSNVPGGGPGLGGLGMRPRFDPIYPPGGPAGPNGGGMGRGRGRGRGRGSGRRNLGDPNPDHMRPPSDFGGDMFM